MEKRHLYRIFIQDSAFGEVACGMFDVIELHITKNIAVISTIYGNKFICLDQSTRLLQCTGLKDKNKKLIYEGDIVLLYNGSINGYFIAKDPFIVEWKSTGWNLPSWLDGYTDKTHFIEVIGNIYENPKLLNYKPELQKIDYV